MRPLAVCNEREFFCVEFFEDGKLPTIRQIINFLEVYQMKDIQVVNLANLGYN